MQQFRTEITDTNAQLIERLREKRAFIPMGPADATVAPEAAAAGAPPGGPAAGMPVDPATGMPVDPATGMPMDPSMMGMPPGAPPMDPSAAGMPPPPPPPPPPPLDPVMLAQALKEVLPPVLEEIGVKFKKPEGEGSGSKGGVDEETKKRLDAIEAVLAPLLGGAGMGGDPAAAGGAPMPGGVPGGMPMPAGAPGGMPMDPAVAGAMPPPDAAAMAAVGGAGPGAKIASRILQSVKERLDANKG